MNERHALFSGSFADFGVTVALRSAFISRKNYRESFQSLLPRLVTAMPQVKSNNFRPSSVST